MLWHIFIPAKFLLGQAGSLLKIIEKAKVIFPFLKKSFLYNTFYLRVRNIVVLNIEASKLLDHPFQYYYTSKISPNEGIQEYLEILETIKNLSNLNQQNLQIFIQPSLYYAKVLSPAEKQNSFISKRDKEVIYNSYVSLNQILLSSKYDYISNLTNIFENETASIYFDPVHMVYENGKNLGHEIIVKKIIEELVQSWGLKLKN